MERIDEEGRLARAVFWGLLAVVALAPLPFGANRPLPWSLLALSVGVLLVLWAVAALRAPGLVRVPIRRIAIPAVLYGMAMVWFLIQAAAWTPAAWHHPLYTQAALALGVPVPGAIALAPEAAQAAVMRLFAYGGIFWLALHYAHDPVRARQILWALALAGTGYAIYGLIIYLGDFQTILWYRKWAYWDALTSTFVNRNSYATYAGLGLVAVLALILRDLEISAPQGLSSRSALLHFVDHVRLSTFILVAAFLVIATALLLTQSRGGLASTLFAGVVLVGARGFSRNRRSTSRFSMSGIALALVAIVLISYSGERTLARFASTERGTSGRAEVYALTVEAIRERPILGTGLDSFPDVFSMRRDDRFPSS
ncbi:MAG: O-antigen ligase family protein, partial [Rhodospirillales bacterium]|nr:O-antigen ligase family protein [Rhodospirillales bacterium]